MASVSYIKIERHGQFKHGQFKHGQFTFKTDDFEFVWQFQGIFPKSFWEEWQNELLNGKYKYIVCVQTNSPNDDMSILNVKLKKKVFGKLFAKAIDELLEIQYASDIPNYSLYGENQIRKKNKFKVQMEEN